MPGSGGSGTMTPPSDGEHVAPVIPLRRREPEPVAPQPARRTLPPEGGVWDLELDPDPALTPASRPRHAIQSVLSLAARHAIASRWLLATVGVALAVAIIVATVWASGGARRHAARVGAAVSHQSTGSTSTDPDLRLENLARAEKLAAAQRALLKHSAHRAQRTRHTGRTHRGGTSTRSHARHAHAANVTQPATSQLDSSQTVAGADQQQQTTAPQQQVYSTPASHSSPPASPPQPWGAGGTLGPGHSPDS